MNCASARLLIDQQLDGLISLQDAMLLREHVASCPSCAAELEMANAVDRVLSESRVLRAPARLDASVASEIVRRAEARRRLESLGIAAACVAAGAAAAFGVSRALDWSAARSALRVLGDAADGAMAILEQPFAGAPEAISTWSQNPGAVGVVLAFAAVAAAFLAVSGLRVARQYRLEWRELSR